MASPRSIGSILITSAPQSASSADAAGTNVCSATSRTRTPSITAVTGTLPLSAPWSGAGTRPAGRNLNLTSTSTIAPCLELPPPGPAGPHPGAHLQQHLADRLAVGDVAQGVDHLGQVELGPDEGAARPVGQERRAARGRCAPFRPGWCVAKSPELEARGSWMPLSSTRLSGMRGMAPDGVAHGHEAAAVVQRRAGPARPGRPPPGRPRRRRRRAARRAAPGAGHRRGGRSAAARRRPGPPRASRASRRPRSPWRPAARRAARRPSRRRRRRRARRAPRPGCERRHRAQHVVRRLVGDAEGGRRPVVHAVGDAASARRRRPRPPRRRRPR